MDMAETKKHATTAPPRLAAQFERVSRKSDKHETKPARRKRRGRPPVAISPPDLYPTIVLSIAQEISPGESDDITTLANDALLPVKADKNVQVLAAGDLGFWLEDYVLNNRLHAKHADPADPLVWAKNVEKTAQAFIKSLGGDSNETLPFESGNDVAASTLARVLPKNDQRDLRRQLRNLEVRAGVAVTADPPRISDYAALVATVRHAGHAAAAILLLAKQLQHSLSLAKQSQKSDPPKRRYRPEYRLRLELFHHLIQIFEQLHKRRFTTPARQESQPKGPGYRWLCALLRLAAGRFGTVYPELAELEQWAETHPPGVAMLIREALEYGKKAPKLKYDLPS
jgi:hypothetical protein